ncbi:undecaprenyl-diphosphate phosphatase [Mangrovibrevibacter kandeliae]|uniref:undecaprenyl-diphosphate phosphatase n=1 Tax=Mangrovibrevibacter kandeliae TaxID=2968473 RepID=UPI00211800AE|nr:MULTISPECIES: undecaprenyl-diphosphate phosphatase [unclassified Aurantimonas]MCQ8782366.1 undecaprenyl-diphosphate phosphatase [Aurantimonas sp. CSK15Z-1]MCW4114987.1 undecaprenyl-diphosphate phosphatase [Aurantimonas sp. MSK8Z-1]
MQNSALDAVILGLTEGLTEFLPVSSTGHILLLGQFLGFRSTGHVFEVVIQLGAVLAIVVVYFARLWQLATSLPSSPRSRRFVAGIALAFLPAAIIGVIAHDFIKRVLFETPMVICVALLVGGILLLVIDRLPLKVRYRDVMDYPLSLCLKIGFFQCLALIPGTSRSGSTIAGALLLGTDKRSAAEFSFFLAMPTMAGAFVYDFYKSRDLLSSSDLWLIAIGFAAAFVAAVVVVRVLLDFVSRHGFAPFAWWRIGVGLVGIVLLLTVSPAPKPHEIDADLALRGDRVTDHGAPRAE